MKLAMIGAGYVGLVSGACFSEFGWDVTCIDLSQKRIASLNEGKIPIYEPGLEQLVRSNAAAGRLHFTTELAAAVRQSDVVFIAVGTPTRRGGNAANLEYVENAARDIARAMQGHTIVVTKSTVPVGTARRIEAIIKKTNPEARFSMASNPEFLREGSAIEDFMHPDRVIVGVEDDQARTTLQRLYRPLSLRDTRVMFTGLETAELTKYAANAFLATKITFINQMADVCESVGANVQELARGMGLDRRIGNKFLHPGPGFGGSCFPKDTRALAAIARDAGRPMSLIEAVSAYNEQRKNLMASRIIAALGGRASGRRIGILGVSFKPNTDDMREAPSLSIIRSLQEEGASIAAYDPEAMEQAGKHLDNVDWKDNACDVARDAHALVIITEWNEFRALDLKKIASVMKETILVDLRNIYTQEEMRQTPFTYISLGRATIHGAPPDPAPAGAGT